MSAPKILPPIPVGVAARIKAKRAQRGWSQEDLARRLGYSRSAIAMLETEAVWPRLTMLLALALAFDCTTDEMLGFDLAAERAKRADAFRQWQEQEQRAAAQGEDGSWLGVVLAQKE